MFDDAPGSPAWLVTFTFGALPANAFTMFVCSEFVIVVLSTEFTTMPSFSRVLDVPFPVTTTSPSLSGFVSRTKSCVMAPADSATVTDFCLKPMRRALMVTCWPLTRAAGTTNV